MRFTKLHGCGNDYVYVDCIRQPPPRDPAGLARVISDRHFGVGGDGLILICPSERADARMRMFNADGSEAEMCGNGVRCVAKYVHDHGIAVKPRLTIETGRGVLTLDLDVRHGKVERVTVDMGPPILDADKIPTTLPGPRVIHYAEPSLAALIDLGGIDTRITCVSMGNPHAVFYGDDVSKVPLEAVGPGIENAPVFPRRINVHFVQVHSPGEVTMRTWERGSGDDARLRHRRLRRGRGRRADRPHRPQAPRPPARRRSRTELVGNRRSCLHDRPRRRSVQRRMAGVAARGMEARSR